MTSPLYNREILALAVALADYPRLADAAHSGESRAPLCGSRVMMDLALDPAGRVRQVGMAVEACALGQAAATLFARGATGRDSGAMALAEQQLTDWLAGNSDLAPDWPGIDLLAPARSYPARHGAILLPFTLATDLLRCGAAEEPA